jgi:DnaA family protein
MTAYQLPLDIQLSDYATFDNFYPGDNSELLTLLKGGGEPIVYFWSNAATGKSHLLQAICHFAYLHDKRAMYLPLSSNEVNPVDAMVGLEVFDLLCIDDVQVLQGDQASQEALFHLLNRLRDTQKLVCITGNAAPDALGLSLKDLVSRLQWGPVFHMSTLSDEDKLRALQLRAINRGIELEDGVAEYLLKHVPRDLHTLFNLLDKLDVASLAAQRRLTIPFVKTML